MNKYLSDMTSTLRGEMSAKLLPLLTSLPADEIRPYVCALADVSEERFAEITAGGNASVQELLALTAALPHLPKHGPRSLPILLTDEAEAILSGWYDKMYAAVTDAKNTLVPLMKAAGAADEAELLTSYYVFFDVSSLCDPQMPVFLDKFLPLITGQENAHRLTVPHAVIRCLNELADDPEQAELSGAGTGLAQLKRIQDSGLLSVRGDETDVTILSTFLSAFSRFKPTYKMILLTQDEVLANAVYLLNSSGVEGPDILIAKLTEGGNPKLWFAAQTEEEEPVAEGMEEIKEEAVTEEEEEEEAAILATLFAPSHSADDEEDEDADEEDDGFDELEDEDDDEDEFREIDEQFRLHTRFSEILGKLWNKDDPENEEEDEEEEDDAEDGEPEDSGEDIRDLLRSVQPLSPDGPLDEALPDGTSDGEADPAPDDEELAEEDDLADEDDLQTSEEDLEDIAQLESMLDDEEDEDEEDSAPPLGIDFASFYNEEDDEEDDLTDNEDDGEPEEEDGGSDVPATVIVPEIRKPADGTPELPKNEKWISLE